jgi:hypothetical protein
MPWFKVDDALHAHPKARAAGLPAMGLWAMAGSYCMSYKTDGAVPAWFVAGWPQGKALAAKLVAARLWETAEDGYLFHDWADFQPTAEEIEAEREKSRERQRARRQRIRAGRSGGVTPPVTRDEPRDVTRESQSPVPSRPDPTVLPTEVPPSGGATRKRAGIRLPDDFKPNADHHELAASLGVDLDAQVARFRDYWLGEGKTKADWNATLRNWLRRAAEDQRSHARPPTPLRRLPHASELERAPSGLSDVEMDEWLRSRR